MRKLVVSSFAVALVLGVLGSPAFAIQAFYNAVVKTYVEPAKGTPLATEIEKQKCAVCHNDPKTKKTRNEYGNALAKLVKKADFGPDKMKDNPDAKMKELAEALKKIEAEKSSDGKTFGERIKDGKLPSAK